MAKQLPTSQEEIQFLTKKITDTISATGIFAFHSVGSYLTFNENMDKVRKGAYFDCKSMIKCNRPIEKLLKRKVKDHE